MKSFWLFVLSGRFEWAGVGFGEEESYKIFRALTVKQQYN
jgi:hypothetical protein